MIRTAAQKTEASSIDRGRVSTLIETLEPEEIAELMGVTTSAIHAILGQTGARAKWMLVCQKTGRYWMCWSERACYFRAQLFGLTDYTFGRAQA